MDWMAGTMRSVGLRVVCCHHPPQKTPIQLHPQSTTPWKASAGARRNSASFCVGTANQTRSCLTAGIRSSLIRKPHTHTAQSRCSNQHDGVPSCETLSAGCRARSRSGCGVRRVEQLETEGVEAQMSLEFIDQALLPARQVYIMVTTSAA